MPDQDQPKPAPTPGNPQPTNPERPIDQVTEEEAPSPRPTEPPTERRDA